MVCGARSPPLVMAARRSRATGGGEAGQEGGLFKAAWICVGPHNDGGWSQAHDRGGSTVQKMLGAQVQTTYKENVVPKRAGPPDHRRASFVTATR